jgi:hypothetical protein
MILLFQASGVGFQPLNSTMPAFVRESFPTKIADFPAWIAHQRPVFQPGRENPQRGAEILDAGAAVTYSYSDYSTPL